jgi:hypothetical protein
MTELLALSAIAAAASSVTGMGIWSWTRLHPRRNPRDVCDEFSLERYEPMARLLARDEVEFLRDAAGARTAARWARARRRIFRLYLRDLASDFGRLHADARALVAESPEQYSDLVGVLMRQQITFLRAMAEIEIRLALSPVGLVRVDARKLIQVIDGMRQELERSVNLAAATA